MGPHGWHHAMHRRITFAILTALLWLPLLGRAVSLALDGPSPIPPPSTGTDPVTDADALFSYGEDTARAYYQVGDDASDGEKRRYFERGIEAGQRAVAQQPAGVEGHFWLAANYGGLSEIQGMWQAFQMVKKVRAEMETALRLQPDYEDGSAYRALGEIARQLPGVLGGNLKRAIAYFEQGLRVAPQNIGLKLALAQAYLEAGQREASQRLLTEILQMPVRPARVHADRQTQDKARQLLRK